MERGMYDGNWGTFFLHSVRMEIPSIRTSFVYLMCGCCSWGEWGDVGTVYNVMWCKYEREVRCEGCSSEMTGAACLEKERFWESFLIVQFIALCFLMYLTCYWAIPLVKPRSRGVSHTLSRKSWLPGRLNVCTSLAFILIQRLKGQPSWKVSVGWKAGHVLGAFSRSVWSIAEAPCLESSGRLEDSIYSISLSFILIGRIEVSA
jgi:hypothetical protein